MKWITHGRPKIDRVACPWLIARFIDPATVFIFVPPSDVEARAADFGAIPFDVQGVELLHVGPSSSFDAFLDDYGLGEPALGDLAMIVRGADTARLDLAPECAGLLAVSLGLSQLFDDGAEQLRHGFVVYDALYAWLTRARGETHSWSNA
jgi:hypothetical protein